MTGREAYKRSNLQHQSHCSTFFPKNKSLPSTTSILSQQANSIIYSTTDSLDKLICTDHLNFEKGHDRFDQLCRFKDDSIYLDVRNKMFKKNDNRDFRLFQNLTMGEAVSNQFMQLKNQQVIATENIGK